MTRIEAFESFSKCPMRSKIYNRVGARARLDCIAFIVNNDELDKREFELKLNLWKLDEEKPKRFTDMWSLVLEANSKAGGSNGR